MKDHKPRQVVMLTNHYFRSRRRAGFHFVAEALARQGQRVRFVTVNVSAIKRMRGHHLFRQEGFAQNIADGEMTVAPNISSRILNAPFSVGPTGNRCADWLLTPLYYAYPHLVRRQVAAAVRDADCLIVEVGPALLLADIARAAAPHARLVYRVSDDLRLLRPHPALYAAERRLLRHSDLVSTPYAQLTARLQEMQPAAKVRWHPHGLSTAPFDACVMNPYPPGTRNVVFVGTSYLDLDFLRCAARLRPDCVFHVIGPLTGLPQAENVRGYGELPFVETVPYIKFADAGLQTLAGCVNIALFAESLKVQQYAYCRLPVIAPAAMPSLRANWFTYELTDDSIGSALARALSFDRTAVAWPAPDSWDAVAAALLND